MTVSHRHIYVMNINNTNETVYGKRHAVKGDYVQVGTYIIVMVLVSAYLFVAIDRSSSLLSSSSLIVIVIVSVVIVFVAAFAVAIAVAVVVIAAVDSIIISIRTIFTTI